MFDERSFFSSLIFISLHPSNREANPPPNPLRTPYRQIINYSSEGKEISMPVRKVASMAACLRASTRIGAGERFTALYETTKLVKYVIMLDGWLESRGIRSFLVVLTITLNKLQHSCNPFFQFEILLFCFCPFLFPLVFMPFHFFRYFTFVRFSLV